MLDQKVYYTLIKINNQKITMNMIQLPKIILLVRKKSHIKIMAKATLMILIISIRIMVAMIMSMSSINNLHILNKITTSQPKIKLKSITKTNLFQKRLLIILLVQLIMLNNLKGKDITILRIPIINLRIKDKKKVSTETKLPGGYAINGLDELKQHLLQKRQLSSGRAKQKTQLSNTLTKNSTRKFVSLQTS